MILNSQKLVELSKVEWQQNQKNVWRSKREKAYNYYKGRTDEYLKEYYKVKQGTPIYDKIPIPTIELTRRVINRISLVSGLHPSLFILILPCYFAHLY